MEITKIWFDGTAPVNAKKASTTIGSGGDGVITITCDTAGTEGNSYTIEAIVATGNDKAMAVALVGTAITVTLGTGVAGAVDATKNTATLIATAINALTNISAVASGTGATAIGSAVAKKSLAGGQFAVECPIPDVILKDATYYYTNPLPVEKRDLAGWKRFQLADF